METLSYKEYRKVQRRTKKLLRKFIKFVEIYDEFGKCYNKIYALFFDCLTQKMEYEARQNTKQSN